MSGCRNERAFQVLEVAGVSCAFLPVFIRTVCTKRFNSTPAVTCDQPDEILVSSVWVVTCDLQKNFDYKPPKTENTVLICNINYFNVFIVSSPCLVTWDTCDISSRQGGLWPVTCRIESFSTVVKIRRPLERTKISLKLYEKPLLLQTLKETPEQVFDNFDKEMERSTIIYRNSES